MNLRGNVPFNDVVDDCDRKSVVVALSNGSVTRCIDNDCVGLPTFVCPVVTRAEDLPQLYNEASSHVC